MNLPPLPEGVELMTVDEWVQMPGAAYGPGSVVDKLRILAITPSHPSYGVKPETWRSIQAAMRAYDGPIDWIITDHDNPHSHAYENVTYHHNRARGMVLSDDYDALLSIEADMIVPEDAIARLIACNSDVAYGLYVWRHKQPRWSAYTDLSLAGGTSLTLQPERARASWGQVIDVAGLGMGCTLVRRDVLETVRFRLYEENPPQWLVDEYNRHFARFGGDPYRARLGLVCDDWYFAMEAAHYGFTQRADLGLVCGHIDGERVLWPDPQSETLYREEPLGAVGD